MRKFPIILSLLLITACSATGEMYKASSMPKGTGEIVVYRGSMPLRTIDVTINGEKCGLKPNGYFAQQVPAGKNIEITADVWDAVHPTKTSVTVKSGQRTYLTVGNRTSAIALVSLGGVLGNAASTDGIFSITEGSLSEAKTKQDSCN